MKNCRVCHDFFFWNHGYCVKSFEIFSIQYLEFKNPLKSISHEINLVNIFHVNVYQILKFKCVCACVDVKIRLKVPSKYFLNLIFISSCHAFASWLHECLHTCKVRVRDKKEFLVWMYEYRCHWCKIISFPWRISYHPVLHFMLIHM